MCGGPVTNITYDYQTPPMYTGVLAESTYNVLTVWWHRTGRSKDRGFKVLWTAFRELEENEGE